MLYHVVMLFASFVDTLLLYDVWDASRTADLCAGFVPFRGRERTGTYVEFDNRVPRVGTC